ncbi:hypothetical protein [Natrinema versiforme]|uniref:DUF7311 domain-containing protein n=1 Tax=Natrinema versiforme TaxID=88724 RepID=A0A4V1FZB0_9EURY|nr:hypothetical protein [Natrinema versiforme]QCS41611.1 hypothetical protein FEJ81_04305 [Natrinema versiforme]
MIRYVVAIVLTVALVVLAVPAIERGASMNSQRQVDASIAAIDDAATSLAESEELSPDGHPDPRRVVDVTLPRGSLTTESVDHFEITPRENGSYSAVRYVLEDGTTRETVIGEPIVRNDPADNESVELGGTGGVRLALTLQADDNGDPVVVASRV